MTESKETQAIRRTIYRSTAVPGVRSVWDWSDKRKCHVQRTKGNRYMATVEKNGKTTTESFGSIEDARKWRERTKFELDKLPDVISMSFAKLVEEFLNSKKQKLQITTIESYKNIARHFVSIHSINVEQINAQIIDKWLGELKSPDYFRKMNIRSVRMSFSHEVVLLRNIFAYYREYYNERYENPVRKRHDENAVIDQARIDEKKRAEKDRFISAQDIDRVIVAFNEQVKQKPEKRIYQVLNLLQLRSGLRIGEACALRWEDICWETGLVTVSKTVQWARSKDRPSLVSSRTKTGSDRTVRFLPDVLEALKALRKDQGRIAGLIFSQNGERILTYRSIQHHYEYAFSQANVKGRSTHILRHSFATHFLEVTLNNNALKELLGHSSVKMTEKYAKTTQKITMAGMQVFEQSLQKVT